MLSLYWMDIMDIYIGLRLYWINSINIYSFMKFILHWFSNYVELYQVYIEILCQMSRTATQLPWHHERNVVTLVGVLWGLAQAVWMLDLAWSVDWCDSMTHLTPHETGWSTHNCDMQSVQCGSHLHDIWHTNTYN